MYIELIIILFFLSVSSNLNKRPKNILRVFRAGILLSNNDPNRLVAYAYKIPVNTYLIIESFCIF